MKRDKILDYRKKYDEEEDKDKNIKDVEEKLRAKFQKNQYITKEDLIRIVEWKFQDRVKGRRKIVLNYLKDVEGFFIEGVSRLVFKLNDDERRLKLLSVIKGIGVALASVILSFYDPQNYGVIDIHAWRELFEVKEPKDLFSNFKHAIKFFNKLREISAQTNLPCRDIEKALFKRNLDESKNKK